MTPTLPPLPDTDWSNSATWLYTDAQMRAYAEQAVDQETERLHAVLKSAESALELGCDALRSEAERYHAEMAGYRPERHQQADDDYNRAETALKAVRAALNAGLDGDFQREEPKHENRD